MPTSPNKMFEELVKVGNRVTALETKIGAMLWVVSALFVAVMTQLVRAWLKF